MTVQGVASAIIGNTQDPNALAQHSGQVQVCPGHGSTPPTETS